MRHGYDRFGRMVLDVGDGRGLGALPGAQSYNLLRPLVTEVTEVASPAAPAVTSPGIFEFVVSLFRVKPPVSTGPKPAYSAPSQTGPVIPASCSSGDVCCAMKRAYPAATKALWDAAQYMGGPSFAQAVDSIVYGQPGYYLSTKTGIVPNYVVGPVIRGYGRNGGQWLYDCVTRRT